MLFPMSGVEKNRILSIFLLLTGFNALWREKLEKKMIFGYFWPFEAPTDKVGGWPAGAKKSSKVVKFFFETYPTLLPMSGMEKNPYMMLNQKVDRRVLGDLCYFSGKNVCFYNFPQLQNKKNDCGEQWLVQIMSFERKILSREGIVCQI